MKKTRFDARSLPEIVEALKSERTDTGDHVVMRVKFNGQQKPTVELLFQTSYPELSHLPDVEEITDWLPDKPGFMAVDDFGNEDDQTGYIGYTSWPELINAEIGPLIKNIIVVGGRYFEYREVF